MVYIRKFSEIKNFQKSKTLEYTLIENNSHLKNAYGVKLKVQAGSSCQEVAVENISTDKELVGCILKYLYENGVDESNFCAVIHDLTFTLPKAKNSVRADAFA